MKLQPGQRGLQTACSHPTGAFPQPRLLNLGHRPRPEGLAPQVSLAAPASGHEGGQAHCLGAFISLKSWPGFWSLALRSRPEWQLGKQFQPDAPEYLFGAGQAPGTPGEERGGPFHLWTPAVPAHVSLRSGGPFPRQTLVEMPFCGLRETQGCRIRKVEGLGSNRSLSPRTQLWRCLKHPLSSSSPWRRPHIILFHLCLL